jgi:sulfopyruvate decarboxylase TPP-binding subunit
MLGHEVSVARLRVCYCPWSRRFSAEAVAANAGLWIGGAGPLVVMQNVGVLASMNALRGVAREQRVPTCMIVGLAFERSRRERGAVAVIVGAPTV